jgi:hypothetical protein
MTLLTLIVVRWYMVREINTSLDVYGVAGGSDAKNDLPLGCDTRGLEEEECCQREQPGDRRYDGST